jgi:hypothetical protein
MLTLLLILCSTLAPQSVTRVTYYADRSIAFVQSHGDAYTCPSALYGRQDGTQAVFSTPGCSMDTVFHDGFQP